MDNIREGRYRFAGSKAPWLEQYVMSQLSTNIRLCNLDTIF